VDNLAVGFIGAGSVGNALALALSATGHRVAAVASRSFASARELAARILGCQAFVRPQQVADVSGLVFITTPDEAIEAVASGVMWHSRQAVVHTSGALGLEVLEIPCRAGAQVGSFHPLQTFLPVEDAKEALALFQGITCAIQAAGHLEETLEGITRALGAHPIRIREADRPLYHASAVMACGYLLALVEAACDLWQEMGFEREDALAALLPLSRSTLQNARRRGLAQAVTGPIVRGDVATARRHLEALDVRAPRAALLYCLLGLESLSFARERGASPEAVAEAEELLRAWLERLVSRC